MTTPRSLVNDEDSLLSPTATWIKLMNKPPHSSSLSQPLHHFPKKTGPIHTGGMDLGTLLAQDMHSNVHLDDHIFADDSNSNDSPANSTISRVSEADLSRVSSVLLGEGQNGDKHRDTALNWSVHNQVRGHQLAQAALYQTHSKEDLVSNGSSQKKKSRGQHAGRISNAGSQGSNKTRKNRNMFSKYMNRLRRRRRKLLDSIFSSNTSSRNGATVGETEEERNSPQIGSHGSTDSADSLEPTDNKKMEATPYGMEAESPRSVYIEGSSELVNHVTADSQSFFSKDVTLETNAENPTPKRSNKAEAIERRKQKKKERNERNKNVMARLTDRYHSARSVRSTPRRRKTSSALSLASSRDHDGDDCDDISITSSLSSRSSQGSRHQRSVVVDSILSSASNSTRSVRQSLSNLSRPRESHQIPEQESSESVAEILKLGKDGEKYLSILRKEELQKQQEKESQRHIRFKRGKQYGLLNCSDTGSEDNASEDGVEVPIFQLDTSMSVPDYNKYVRGKGDSLEQSLSSSSFR